MEATLPLRAQEIFDEVVSMRRHLHMNPELSFEEKKTSAFIQEKLKAWNIPFENNWAGTGVVAMLDNGKSKWIALRADMDALPINEKNHIDYRSKNSGVMHACGHDVHTATLLGTAKILSERRSALPVNIKFIFQPGEEKLPGGASLLIEQGVLKRPDVAEIYGLHVFPEMDCGNVGLKSGLYMASGDEIRITVHGTGGHAAMPENYINPLMIASRLLIELDERIRIAKPEKIPTVLAFGKITGLGATNVIPDEVKLEGTFRTMDETWRQTAHNLIRNISGKVGSEMKGRCEVDILAGYPVLVNDPVQTERTRKILMNHFGAAHVSDLPIRMTCEDFAWYSHHVPSTFIRVGVRNTEKEIVSPVHTATFDADEKALVVGIETFLAIVFDND